MSEHLKLTALASPVEGKAWLSLWSQPILGLPERRFVVSLASTPWTPLERPPFAYYYQRPVGRAEHGILRLVVDRNTLVAIDDGKGGEEGSIFSARYGVEIQLLRIQSSRATMPSEGDILSFSSLAPIKHLPESRFVSAYPDGRTDLRLIERRDLRVVATPWISTHGRIDSPARSTTIEQLDGGFSVQISVIKPLEPASYWYWYANGNHESRHEGSVVIVVVHSDNVMVRSIESLEANIRLHTHAIESSLLTTRKVLFQDHDMAEGIPDIEDINRLQARLENERPDGEVRRILVDVMENVVGLIPGVGDLYDLGVTSYVVATGRHPLTQDEVPPSQRLLMGTLALLPLVPAAKGMIRRSRSIVDSELEAITKVVEGVDPVEITSVRGIASVGLLREDAALRVTSKALEAVEGRIVASDFAEALRKEFESVGPAGLSTVKGRYEALSRMLPELRNVIDVELKIFSDVSLERNFQAYLRKRKLAREEASLVDWACSQTRGGPRSVLERRLGSKYKEILEYVENGALEEARVASRALAARHYDKYVVVIAGYQSLPVKGYGAFLERDHLIEKRFFRNNRRVEARGGEVMLENGLALLVPKNQRAAELLGGQGLYTYIHSEKTRMLRELLPVGGEEVYQLQSIWDAHVFFYQRQGLAPDFEAHLLKSLESELLHYADLSSSRKQRVSFVPRTMATDAGAFSLDRMTSPYWWADGR